ncbi:hypothetical protein CC78DRAFT_539669 [Lojkania enalia]|uniref:BTB domain-containing protein n=1 Tax=Lojkania enalia TaxID=147567 RepID=A0A9P4TPR6_9PLEO|nr:hypothetical protein CC78DRAFT_539669 [Didymosphaeria enalia]
MGITTSFILKDGKLFIRNEVCEKLADKYPDFGANMFYASQQRRKALVIISLTRDKHGFSYLVGDVRFLLNFIQALVKERPCFIAKISFTVCIRANAKRFKPRKRHLIRSYLAGLGSSSFSFNNNNRAKSDPLGRLVRLSAIAEARYSNVVSILAPARCWGFIPYSNFSFALRLFNDPTRSDVKIRQVYNGQAREYIAHRQILCGQSRFFKNAFTGNFKEATEPIVEFHDDDPNLFEVMLNFAYTATYDKRIFPLAADDFYSTIDGKSLDFDVARSVIESQYKDYPNSNSSLGRVLARAILEDGMGDHASSDNNWEELATRFPMLGADLAIHICKRGTLTARKFTCKARIHLDRTF